MLPQESNDFFNEIMNDDNILLDYRQYSRSFHAFWLVLAFWGFGLVRTRISVPKRWVVRGLMCRQILPFVYRQGKTWSLSLQQLRLRNSVNALRGSDWCANLVGRQHMARWIFQNCFSWQSCAAVMDKGDPWPKLTCKQHLQRWNVKMGLFGMHKKTSISITFFWSGSLK